MQKFKLPDVYKSEINAIIDAGCYVNESEVIRDAMIGATAMILDGVLASDDGHFEDLIARYVGTKYAVTFNSGTSALHAVLLAHEK